MKILMMKMTKLLTMNIGHSALSLARGSVAPPPKGVLKPAHSHPDLTYAGEGGRGVDDDDDDDNDARRLHPLLRDDEDDDDDEDDVLVSPLREEEEEEEDSTLNTTTTSNGGGNDVGGLALAAAENR